MGDGASGVIPERLPGFLFRLVQYARIIGDAEVSGQHRCEGVLASGGGESGVQRQGPIQHAPPLYGIGAGAVPRKYEALLVVLVRFPVGRWMAAVAEP